MFGRALEEELGGTGIFEIYYSNLPMKKERPRHVTTAGSSVVTRQLILSVSTTDAHTDANIPGKVHVTVDLEKR